MEAKYVRLKILINNSEAHLIKNSLCDSIFLWLKQYTSTCFNEKYLSLKLFTIFSFKIDSINLEPDPDPNWAKIMDPDPNSMYLDPQNCLKVFKKS